MNSFEVAVKSYIEEHGFIDSVTYKKLSELYTTEISGQTRREAEAARLMRKGGTEKGATDRGVEVYEDKLRGQATDSLLKTAALRFKGDINEVVSWIKKVPSKWYNDDKDVEDKLKKALKILEDVKSMPLDDWKELGTMGNKQIGKQRWQIVNKVDLHTPQYDATDNKWWHGKRYADEIMKARGLLISVYDEIDRCAGSDASGDFYKIPGRLKNIATINKEIPVFDSRHSDSGRYDTSVGRDYESRKPPKKDEKKRKRVSLAKDGVLEKNKSKESNEPLPDWVKKNLYPSAQDRYDEKLGKSKEDSKMDEEKRKRVSLAKDGVLEKHKPKESDDSKTDTSKSPRENLTTPRKSLAG